MLGFEIGREKRTLEENIITKRRECKRDVPVQFFTHNPRSGIAAKINTRSLRALAATGRLYVHSTYNTQVDKFALVRNQLDACIKGDVFGLVLHLRKWPAEKIVQAVIEHVKYAATSSRKWYGGDVAEEESLESVINDIK